MPLVIKTTGIEDYLDGGEAFVKALVLGPPSAGKTRSASFWPKPIFADCENGRMSIADRSMPYGEIKSTQDMTDLLRMLQVECQKPVNARRYQTLVIDTIDAYQRIVIQERLTSERKEALQGFADWGYLDAKMTQLIAKLQQLPMNIVVNLHVTESKDGDDGPLVIQPKLKGDIRTQIAAEFDLVGLMGSSYEAQGGERVLKRSIQWHSEPRVPILKDRSGRLPKHTPVTFTSDDYEQLFVPLIEALDSLQASKDLETLGESDYTPEPPQPGGAVASPEPAKAPAKKAPAKKAAAPAVPKATRPTMEVVEKDAPAGADAAPAPAESPKSDLPAQELAARTAARAATPVPAATSPVETEVGPVDPASGELAAPPMDEHQVAEALGGQIVQEIHHPDEEPPATPQPPADEPAPTSGRAPTCGTPGKKADGSVNPNPVPGCGKDLAEESRDVVNIGFIRTTREGRPTYLCAACIAAHRAAAGK